jgi:hypothetical protein
MKKLDSNNIQNVIHNVCYEYWISASKETLNKKWIKTNKYIFD